MKAERLWKKIHATPCLKGLYDGVCAMTIICILYLIAGEWKVAIVIFASMILHELGHFYAFRKRNKNPTGPFLIPLGGAIVDNEVEASGMTYFEVAIRGPATALGSAVPLILYWITDSVLLKQSALFWAGINWANSWPFYPLDGGQAVSSLLSSRPWLRRGYAVLTLLIFTAGCIHLGFWWLAPFMLILGFLALTESWDKKKRRVTWKQALVGSLSLFSLNLTLFIITILAYLPSDQAQNFILSLVKR